MEHSALGSQKNSNSLNLHAPNLDIEKYDCTPIGSTACTYIPVCLSPESLNLEEVFVYEKPTPAGDSTRSKFATAIVNTRHNSTSYSAINIIKFK